MQIWFRRVAASFNNSLLPTAYAAGAPSSAEELKRYVKGKS
ncbi:MAG: hypothetical protein ABR553_09145 [Gammaproteobacteria bacterium]